MRSFTRVSVAVILAGALAGACSSSGSKSTTPKSTTSTSAAPVSVKQLEARLVTAIPAGFVRQPDRKYDTGPSDLAKAIKDDGSPDAAKVLRAEQFVRGYQRIWIGPGKAQIVVFVYQFNTRTGARQDYARAIKGFDAAPPPGVHTFEVPGLPSGQATGVAGTSKDLAAAAVYFTTGVYSVEINCNGTKLSGLQERATSIAVDQFARL